MSYLPRAKRETAQPEWRKETRVCLMCPTMLYAADERTKQEWERRRCCSPECARESWRKAASRPRKYKIGRASW